MPPPKGTVVNPAPGPPPNAPNAPVVGARGQGQSGATGTAPSGGDEHRVRVNPAKGHGKAPAPAQDQGLSQADRAAARAAGAAAGDAMRKANELLNCPPAPKEVRDAYMKRFASQGEALDVLQKLEEEGLCKPGVHRVVE